MYLVLQPQPKLVSCPKLNPLATGATKAALASSLTARGQGVDNAAPEFSQEFFCNNVRSTAVIASPIIWGKVAGSCPKIDLSTSGRLLVPQSLDALRAACVRSVADPRLFRGAGSHWCSTSAYALDQHLPYQCLARAERSVILFPIWEGCLSGQRPRVKLCVPPTPHDICGNLVVVD